MYTTAILFFFFSLQAKESLCFCTLRQMTWTMHLQISCLKTLFWVSFVKLYSGGFACLRVQVIGSLYGLRFPNNHPNECETEHLHKGGGHFKSRLKFQMHIAIGIHQIGQLYSVRVCRKDVQKVLYGSLYALNTPSDHSNVCEKLRGQFIMTPSLFSFIFLQFPFLSLKVSKVLPFQAENIFVVPSSCSAWRVCFSIHSRNTFYLPPIFRSTVTLLARP